MLPIDFFWRAAQRWPHRIAIDTPTERIAFQVLAQRVRAVAAGLVRCDPTPQSRVAICASNSAEHIVALLAVLACGKVWVPLNPKSTQAEIRRITDVVDASLLVIEADLDHLVTDEHARRIVIGSADAQRMSLDELAQAHANDTLPMFAVNDEDTQAIKFTGGTTGAPKGVMQPYRAWMANIVNQIHAWAFDENDRYVMAAPITHGTSTYVLPILAQGGCHVILDGVGVSAVRDAFKHRGGTVCFMPPTMAYMLMGIEGVTRADFPQLKRLIYGGAPMPPEKIREVRAFFGPVLGTTYGQTEAPQILTVMRPEDFEDEANWAAVGRCTWFSDVAIMSPQGSLLPPGEVGEVVARGPLVMTGYWQLPEQTSATLVDGWLHTGDRGLIDTRGYLYLKDRLKDIVITGGFNVYPVEVENALSQHPAVHESAVFGLPDDKWGESVNAAVQLRPGHSASAVELAAFVRERLGPVQTPKRIHVVNDLPRSPVGKVLKNAVRDMALTGQL
ncbi:MAG: AMP-binding protein [Hydrogenophaga sp.]|uniref:class I adenylate-forming enzyme family protein n=1 Tax=Hydrogenophaga sp. TaxID=1904254 RepID=UPI001DE946D9|nr:AMP-binding protein [Hydrogenophaga sp.]MBX3610848.1 AMP-binding protein [Hydrogenophaga sp.]